MNCHGNNDNGSDGNGHGHGNGRKGMSHMLMMALCCGAPILIFLLIPLISKIGGPGVSNALLGIAPFLCPLMMVFMIPMMFKGNKNNNNRENVSYAMQEQLEEKNSDNNA